MNYYGNKDGVVIYKLHISLTHSTKLPFMLYQKKKTIVHVSMIFINRSSSIRENIWFVCKFSTSSIFWSQIPVMQQLITHELDIWLTHADMNKLHFIAISKFWEEGNKFVSYSKVPITRVETWVLRSEAIFARPKSATCVNRILILNQIKIHNFLEVFKWCITGSVLRFLVSWAKQYNCALLIIQIFFFLHFLLQKINL
jgi:hypothetical protein